MVPEVLHNVYKFVICVRLIPKCLLHIIKVCKSVVDIEVSFGTSGIHFDFVEGERDVQGGGYGREE